MSTPKAFDLLVVGEINPDLILTGDVEPVFGQVEKLVDSATLTVGSSSAIFACGAARLGLKTAFVGVCGADVFGRFMLEQMRLRGIDTDYVQVRAEGATGLSVILVRGVDRAILTYPGLIPALRAEDVPSEVLGRVRHIHVASYFLQTNLQPGLPGLFREARARGVTTSLDTNYDPSGQWQGFETLLAETDVLFLNEVEACSLSREADVESAARKLATRVGTVAIKLGARGALAVQGHRRVYAPGLPVTVVDTVGAGDSFDAGFICGYLNGWDLERALRLAVICGSLSTRAAGGTAAQPTLTEALDVLVHWERVGLSLSTGGQ
ncbi:carbohydrate kinase family protein [uncultured Thermanaerothrix sp.]|uniref:carbohydrate kinase family protein n=1 Tax=uncultured Thermanaerothrix sp. TaxID=1195149 RepID=UPI0026079789|nr:sugar kinase [uncultured Thermanaerothrix sp.]